MTSLDWYRWHDSYDELESPETAVLAEVQHLVVEFLDTVPVGPVRVLSMAAGQLRELIPVLITHARGRDVSAVVVEFDGRNTDLAEGALQSAELDRIVVVTGDAGVSDSYADGVPADLLLCSGLFEYLSDEDARRTVEALPHFCAPGASIVYSHNDVDRRATLESYLSAAGFDIVVDEHADRVVGRAVMMAEPVRWRKGIRLFDMR